MVGNRRRPVYDPIHVREGLRDEEIKLLRKRGLVENEEIWDVWRLEKYKTEYISLVTVIIYVSLIAEMLVFKAGWLDAFTNADAIAQLLQCSVLGLSVLVFWNGYGYVESAMSSSKLILFSHDAILGGYKTRKHDVRRTLGYSVIIVLCLMNGFYGIAAVYLLSTLWLRLCENLLRYRIEEKINHIRRDSVNHGVEC